MCIEKRKKGAYCTITVETQYFASGPCFCRRSDAKYCVSTEPPPQLIFLQTLAMTELVRLSEWFSERGGLNSIRPGAIGDIDDSKKKIDMGIRLQPDSNLSH